jgi:hypothetical protein
MEATTHNGGFHKVSILVIENGRKSFVNGLIPRTEHFSDYIDEIISNLKIPNIRKPEVVQSELPELKRFHFLVSYNTANGTHRLYTVSDEMR